MVRPYAGCRLAVPGISQTSVSDRSNRIEIGMYPLRGALGDMEAALAALDIPRGAVVIDVGCEGGSQPLQDDGVLPDEAFLRAIEYSLEVLSEAPYGETVQMKLTLRNVSDEPLSFFLGGRPAYDFVVTKPDGGEVWHWMCAKITLAALFKETLDPGEELEFTGEWEQTDNRGEPVSAGIYLVRGVLRIDPREKLVTLDHQLEVLQ